MATNRELLGGGKLKVSKLAEKMEGVEESEKKNSENNESENQFSDINEEDDDLADEAREK